MTDKINNTANDDATRPMPAQSIERKGASETKQVLPTTPDPGELDAAGNACGRWVSRRICALRRCVGTGERRSDCRFAKAADFARKGRNARGTVSNRECEAGQHRPFGQLEHVRRTVQAVRRR